MKRRNIITSAALTAVCLILVIPIIVYTFPFLAGADSSYTVMSGSMAPALSPGDLVIVKGEEPIDIGDMVTVESGEFIFTHRVVEKLEGDRFRLKGDANEDPDQGLIESSQIIGKVVLVFPFGHLYTPYGFALALLAPASLIIGKQVQTIYQFTKRRNKRETMRFRRKSKSALDTSTLLLALILTVSTTRVIAPNFISGSSSYFSDVEWATGVFRAGNWVIDITAKSNKIDALSELESIDYEYGKGKEVINHIQKSLNIDPKNTDKAWKKYSLWVDDDHLDPQHGHHVFDEEKKAVKELMHLIDDIDDQEVKARARAVIDELIEADKMLAETAYEEAKAHAGDPDKLDKCYEDLIKAQNELINKKYDKAIDHYKHAWKHAQEAWNS